MVKNNSASQALYLLNKYIYHEASIYRQNVSGVTLPTVTYIECSSYCARDCIDCYVPKEDRKNDSIISNEMLDSAMKHCTDLGVKIYAILGGEPLRRKTLPSLKYLADTYPENLFFICTNGDYLASNHPDASDLIMHDNISIVLSIDGISSKTHDSIRGRGSYDNAMKAADLLHANKRVFGAITVIRPENLEEVTSNDYIDWIISKGNSHLFYTFTDRVSDDLKGLAVEKISGFKRKPIFMYTSEYGHLGETSKQNLSRMLSVDKYGQVLDARKERHIIGTVNDDLHNLGSNYQWLKKFQD